MARKKNRTGGKIGYAKGGIHKYYSVEDVHPKKVILSMPDGRHLGEIQAEGQYVVGPGSIHPNGNRYFVENECCGIALTNYEDLVERFRRAGVIVSNIIGKSESLSSTEKSPLSEFDRVFGNPTGLKIDNMDFYITDVWDISNFIKVGSDYLGPSPVHGSTSGRNLSVNKDKNLWHCFRCNSGGGPIAALAVDMHLIDCCEAKPGKVRGELFKKVVQEAKKKRLI